MKLGEWQTLTVVKILDFGAYLAADRGADSERVLLPKAQVPKGTKLYDEIAVFLYRDSKDRPIATTRTPKLTLHGLAVLRVKQVTKIGAFLDWGLEKDLFLPYKEQAAGHKEQNANKAQGGRHKEQISRPDRGQTSRLDREPIRQPADSLKKGDEILVTMYIDKSGRLCASQRNLYHLLRTDPPCAIGDIVEARVYEFGHDFGTFLAVDDQYSAMIPASEDCSDLRIGQVISARITGIKPDGKVDLTRREKAHLQIDRDAQTVLALIESYGGHLPFNDKASPERIMREAHMSKGAFKRAVGHLYKERRIVITPEGIDKA